MAGATNAVAAPAKGKPTVAVTATRVEGLDRAEGIDCPRPRFSWQIDAAVPNVKQTAYRIRVASSPQLLRKGKADIWDSGRQPSGRQLYIDYAGQPLASGTRYYYQIESETTAGSAVSRVGNWLTGLMDRTEWRSLRAPRC